LILAGKILVNGQKITKAGTAVAADSIVEMIGTVMPYVGRGGLKLAAALERWNIDITGLVALDIGSSTGGFTDCLLQRGAIRVHAVDAGTNQLDWKLRNDCRVHLLENTNARYLQFDQIGEQVDFVCIDVSFISVKLILSALIQFCRTGTRLVLLIKPQFEAGREQVGKGGIVRDQKVQQNVVSIIQRAVLDAGFRGLDVFPCPVLGAEGNQEYLLHGTFELEQPPQSYQEQATP
jgi:23S rRNA (cytidine1920-2'-O)/16S rRNA (cytidine1409-2'-O)-methyltransferase